VNDPLSRDRLLALLRELVAIPSVNPTLAPDEPGGEAPIAIFCRDWLNACGIRAWTEEVAPGRANAVAELGGGAGPTLVLCGHLDTVSARAMAIPPFEARLEDGRVYGRGAYDMKGGVAAIMAAAAALSGGELPGRVLLALVCDEEVASLGADDFVRRHRADACILTEPSAGELVLAHKGFVWAELTTTGVTAHGSRWEEGRSAIGRMARIAAELERHDAEELRRRTHPLLGPASLHCAMISGGSGLSTYAAQCRLSVERRTLPGETPDQVRAELESAVRRAAEDAVVEIRFSRPPLVCDRDAPIARAVRDAAAAVTGRPPRESGVAYWMDAAIFAGAGIPAVNFGGGGAGAHAAVEWADLDSCVTTARVLVEAARRFCAAAPGDAAPRSAP